jgi:hypothetical protein
MLRYFGAVLVLYRMRKSPMRPERGDIGAPSE